MVYNQFNDEAVLTSMFVLFFIKRRLFMYCYNCGAKIDEKAVICVKCGVPIVNMQNKAKARGTSIAGFVLGILGIIYCVLSFIGLLIFLLDGTANFVTNLIDTIFAYGITIPGLCLSLAARKKEKNGLNTTGFILNLISIILATIWLFFI
jgi:predicted nucleic acid-binding Zn ribbon protein